MGRREDVSGSGGDLVQPCSGLCRQSWAGPHCGFCLALLTSVQACLRSCARVGKRRDAANNPSTLLRGGEAPPVPLPCQRGHWRVLQASAPGQGGLTGRWSPTFPAVEPLCDQRHAALQPARPPSPPSLRGHPAFSSASLLPGKAGARKTKEKESTEGCSPPKKRQSSKNQPFLEATNNETALCPHSTSC